MIRPVALSLILLAACPAATLGAEAPADLEHLLTAGEEAEQTYLDSMLQAELVEPAYRASIFSSQPEKRLVIRLTRKAEMLEDAKVLVTLRQADGGELGSRELARVGETATFDAAGLAPGRYVVTCSAAVEWLPGLVQSLPVSVLPPAEHEVTFNSDGVCLVDGRPFFPLGLYHLENTLDDVNQDNIRAGEPTVTMEQMFERVAAKGFNAAVSCSQGDVSFLDLGAKHGLRILQFADIGVGDDPTRFTRWIEQIRDHPALLAISIVDEPCDKNRFVEAAMRHRLARDLDPYHPVQVTQCASDMYAATSGICDILAIDSYPLNRNPWWLNMPWWEPRWGRSSLRLVTRYSEQVRQLQGPHRPFWWVVQAFGDAGSWEEPTPQQLRSQAYQAIVAGARGLLFYAYLSGEKQADGRMWWIEKSRVLWEACGRLNAELRALEPVLVAPGGRPLPCRDAEDLRALGREHEGKLYVFAVNIGERAQALSLDLPAEWAGATIEADRGAPRMDTGRLTDRLEPFESHVYKLGKPGP